MGFRSTFVTNDYGVSWPTWFKEKYTNSINFGSCLSSIMEVKLYSDDLITDIHAALHEIGFYRRTDSALHLTLLILHECDGVTRYQFYEKEIICSEPSGPWKRQSGITHNYCYECARDICE